MPARQPTRLHWLIIDGKKYPVPSGAPGRIKVKHKPGGGVRVLFFQGEHGPMTDSSEIQPQPADS